ncbi:aminodeoxychorismate synthase component I [Actinosynnema pretiosum]|uniref:aminodeoxychorismate synthase n=1 Tax=Actinosynnema pretiosum TaxID=42197 RepID=A0A290ZC89_9PSEU|nr:aminodeoxychorismate synthase component I [Actinosynnema pretiosum]ATE56594.1 aminodeoxychorismate synthase, component I [Actinosynnema pretiosum]
MRTLLIDNLDSFTGNLAHLVARVNGREPDVIRHDDPDFRLADLRRYDAVLISPGPGRPDDPRDFGLCAAVVEHAEIPLLGVCLGHQGLCLGHGATVARVTPRHGIVDEVAHTGTDLFAGLPSPLRVVRYHSLAATDLPPELEPLAWAPGDGVLMAVRRRGRPAWGVQFHPESVAGEHGFGLLANFRDLAGGRAAPTPPPPPPAPAEAAPRRLLVRSLDVHPDPEAVHAALHGASPDSFWLDSSRADAARGRFSVIGDASGPLARVARYDVTTGRVRVTSAAGAAEHDGPLLDWLEADLAAWRVDAPDLPFDFALGWVGYLGYELKAECGGDAVHRSGHPDAALVFADRALVFDHREKRCHLLALEGADGGWLDRAEEFLRAFRTPEKEFPVPLRGEVELRHDRERYLKLVDACLEAVAAGESYEVCLTNRGVVPGRIDPWRGYRFLRARNPAPYGALLRFGELSVLSCSPERFVRVDRSGCVESEPIKGTRPRGGTPEEDAALRAELAVSVKDRAENLMVVDLVRNDLSRCSEVGSVRVPRLFAVETYATAHQLVSTVRGRLAPGRTAVSAVRSAFPGGSMTGAPKIRTMQILDALEAGPRGVYSGALGYFSLCGAADFSVVIRTLVADARETAFGVGGAVIALSDPEAEFEETAVKATAALALFQADFPGR